MKRSSTLFLRLALIILAALVLVVLIFSIKPALGLVDADGFRPIILGMFAAAVPFYIALYQAMKLLDLIDKNDAFSLHSVRLLNIIKYCGVSVGVLYAAYFPMFYIRAQTLDAPGLPVIDMVISGASFVIAVFAAVLQQLLKSAIEYKSENDLTV